MSGQGLASATVQPQKAAAFSAAVAEAAGVSAKQVLEKVDQTVGGIRATAEAQHQDLETRIQAQLKQTVAELKSEQEVKIKDLESQVAKQGTALTELSTNVNQAAAGVTDMGVKITQLEQSTSSNLQTYNTNVNAALEKLTLAMTQMDSSNKSTLQQIQESIRVSNESRCDGKGSGAKERASPYPS